MSPNYSLDKIKFGVDVATFQKALDLYESGKVEDFQEGIRSYSAVVLGTRPYRVSVEARRYDYGHGECYLGENDTLCKHMIAVALWAVKKGQPLDQADKHFIAEVVCSGKSGELTAITLKNTKKTITNALRYIKPYNGPSRQWFSYQASLAEGCSRLTKIVSELPVSEQTAKLVVNILLRLDKKLCYGGVDDSDGAVGGFIEETVEVLQDYAKLDAKVKQAFKILKNKETSFGWEERLVKLSKKKLS